MPSGLPSPLNGSSDCDHRTAPEDFVVVGDGGCGTPQPHTTVRGSSAAKADKIARTPESYPYAPAAA